MTIATDLSEPRKRFQPPPAIGPFDPDTWYLGTDVAEMFGSNWQSWLNARNEGQPTPKATRISGRIYFKGSDLIAWLDSRREEG